jgi:hypothetical protein
MNIPEHYKRAVIPHIIVKDAAAAIQFYASVFGASQLFRLDSDEGTITHAEISVQGSTLMLSDPHPPYSLPGPGGAPVILHVSTCPTWTISPPRPWPPEPSCSNPRRTCRMALGSRRFATRSATSGSS